MNCASSSKLGIHRPSCATFQAFQHQLAVFKLLLHYSIYNESFAASANSGYISVIIIIILLLLLILELTPDLTPELTL